MRLLLRLADFEVKMKMTNRLAKICTILPCALYGILLLILNIYLVFFAFEGSLSIFLFRSLGWIPSLIFSVLGIVFSSLTLRERGAKICLLLSCMHCVLAFAWGILVVKLLFTGHFRIL